MYIPLRPMKNIENSIYLFVEGEFDKEVLNCIFDGKPVIVEFLGSCEILRRIAYSPNIADYSLFLIDRDHYSFEKDANDHFLFPKLEWKNHLVIWPKRELENYFIDADFLVQLPENIRKATKEAIEERILKICQKRLFLDVANYVINSLRVEMRDEWIDNFRNSDLEKCQTRDDFLHALLRMDAWKTIQSRASQLAEPSEIERRFRCYHELMVGDFTERLTLGQGKWLNMTSGKDVLNELVNNTGFFASNITVNDVAKQLLRIPGVKLPDDFIDLRNTMIQRTKQIIK